MNYNIFSASGQAFTLLSQLQAEWPQWGFNEWTCQRDMACMQADAAILFRVEYYRVHPSQKRGWQGFSDISCKDIFCIVVLVHLRILRQQFDTSGSVLVPFYSRRQLVSLVWFLIIAVYRWVYFDLKSRERLDMLNAFCWWRWFAQGQTIVLWRADRLCKTFYETSC